MKKLYRKLQFVNRQIRDTKAEIKNVKTLPFYDVFKREGQRQTDLQALHEALKELLSQKSSILDSMALKINAIKADVSEEEREVTLIKNTANHAE